MTGSVCTIDEKLARNVELRTKVGDAQFPGAYERN